MELDGNQLPDGGRLDSAVVVVGGGPAGIVTALELERAGHEVTLLESGGVGLEPDAQRLGEGGDPGPHHLPLSMAGRRQLGGGSVTWGGRCVPFDPIDFDQRPIAGAHWPVTYDEVARHFPLAAGYMRCGEAVFDAQQIPALAGRTMVPGLPDEEIRTSSLERWSLPTNFAREYRGRLRRSRRVRVVLHQTCTRIVLTPDGDSVQQLETRALNGRRSVVVGRRYVLACGGLETTRLLMASGVGDHSGHLGRWYMAHSEGGIAKVRFSTPARETIYSHERDPDGVYVRRRFTFSREFLNGESIPNCALWLVNPDLADPRHHNGPLSLVYLLLSSRAGSFFTSEVLRDEHLNRRSAATTRQHFRNLVRSPASSARFAGLFGYQRYIKRGRRAPGFATYSAQNVYPLRFQGEHLPHRDSHVALTDEDDAFGVPRLSTNIVFDDAEIDGVLAAHRHVDAYLRRHGCGRLEYESGDLAELVREQFTAGCHQAGTTRMSARPGDGVVDADLTVHGVGNLSVASSSVFVTSGHANPTFMIVALAVRLAQHLRHELGAPLHAAQVTP